MQDMKDGKSKDFIIDKLFKRVMIPLNVLFIIAGCGYLIHKISGKTIANKIEEAIKKW